MKGIKFSALPNRPITAGGGFEDLYGNLWDLLLLNPDHPIILENKNSSKVKNDEQQGF